MRRPALTLGLLLLLGSACAARAQGPFLLEPTPEEKLIGAVDVCVRWGADPAHLADVIMTNSSGDTGLDAQIPDMIRSIPYPRPADDTGEWFGLNLSFGAAEPHHALPDCDAAVSAAPPLDPPATPDAV
ncbi:MAG TPA: hypothetical protein VGM25_16560 [Caulobacteraceae bacterium]|jgi:hypothetical protein